MGQVPHRLATCTSDVPVTSQGVKQRPTSLRASTGRCRPVPRPVAAACHDPDRAYTVLFGRFSPGTNPPRRADSPWAKVVESNTPSTFWGRNEFLIRRLHSLSGLIPVGAYMVVHLLTNASLMNGPGTFQRAVYQIHSLGRLLPVVEWLFIFGPLLFHAIVGVVIIQGGRSNYDAYPYRKNLRYTFQRATGMIAMLFIFWHVFHMHGWFHFDAWRQNVVEPLGGARFRPFNAASSVAQAMRGTLAVALYFVGITSCVFHLANGLWTMGITWGLWTSPAAQRRADRVCIVFGIGLFLVSMSALAGTKLVDTKQALDTEDRMHRAKTAAGEVDSHESDHKRWSKAERERVEAVPSRTERSDGDESVSMSE